MEGMTSANFMVEFGVGETGPGFLIPHVPVKVVSQGPWPPFRRSWVD